MLNKAKRLFTSLLPVDPNRTGECSRCGACCKLPYPCPFLRFDDAGLSSCAVYAIRPPSCRKYPRVAAEQLTPQECGYSFVTVDDRVADGIGLDPVTDGSL
ncbi:hypothetical protein THIOKS12630004 [Thiocapsa sp. KS1]|jgi:Fe-S-cluster containining protein|nr:hypothetical protein [Thiocapsa sp. KS1]CRI66085.1 hypothetical protein THIOKS12630004 [Thiocapsa sp. KS1]